MNTTCTATTNTRIDSLTLDSLMGACEAFKKVSSTPRLCKVEVNKKTYKSIKDVTTPREVYKLGDLFGVPIFVKPYIKKMKLYYER